MAQQINISDTLSLVPSGYDSNNSSYSSVNSSYPISNGYTDASSTTYAYITCNTGSGASTYISYTFDCSAIPVGATITSVTCSAKVRVSSTSYISTATTQMYSGSTAMGSATTTRSNTATSYNLTPGTWTRAQLQSAEVRFTANRGTSNTSRAAYLYFYGATLSIAYSYSGMQYTLTATSEINDVTIQPVASQKMSGESQTFTITLGNTALEDISITDNDVDIINSLVTQTIGGDGSVSAVPGSNVTTGHARSNGAFYQSSSTQSDSWLRYAIGHSAESPYSTSNTSNTYTKDDTNDATTQGWMNYPFDFSSIPENATITSMQVKCYGATESTSESARHADISLWCGDTQKGATQAFTSTSNSTITLSNVGTWTRAELQNAILRFGVGYYGGRLLGVTWTVNYTAPITTIYTYTLSNIINDHEIVISQAGAFIPPEEDPQKTYYPITISSINATTDPKSGTTRVESGINQIITISPIDPQLTLALDNGIDITNQLVGGVPNNTYTVTTKGNGASYGFNLNSSTGYYVSSNNGVSSSASVARVNFDLESDVLVTIQYINQGQSQADYGMFGKIDTTVSTTGNTYSSSSASPDDPNNYYYMCATASDSTTTVKTLTYNISSGQHYIDIKYAKDQASDSGNDSLQWKIISVEATSAGGTYTYTLSNVSEKHSLIFVFGDVDYYFITSSGTNSKLYPDGQIVKLAGENYDLVIVPNDPQANVTINDNGIDRTSYLQYEQGTDKNNNTIVNYIYRLTNISAAHNLIISCVSSGASTDKIYLKINGTWTLCSKVYKKINGTWVEQTNYSQIFDERINYIKR